MRGLHYVAIAPGLASDPRITTMAKALKRDPYWVAGHFPEFFGAVAEHCADGDLSAIDDELLDKWAGGVKGFGALVRAHLCENGVLRAWSKYNGRALTQLQKDRDRKAERRQNIRADSVERPRNVGGKSADIPRPIPEPEPYHTSSPSEKKQIISSPRAREVLEAMATHAPEFLEDCEAMFRGHPDPDAIARAMQGLMQGMHLQPGEVATWAHIGQAVQDAKSNGERVTAQRLRIFVGSQLRGPRHPPTDLGESSESIVERALARTAGGRS